ncbi:transcription antitermination factor NusB [Arcanobacterium pinnipediorum]|uniref:Transcription antitermination protein NusB n=1 Tax=Arcanobacterium pinnipediorum TaxID=1503041 RepID=A0ABY5ALA9_9ACTO|nr:transcription antitermination factor NusB [Arcanobacterium pinnipediorum]USR80191.1 transcription antitermination factor NusB [Arcanobacterium pinnipediorum]
MSTTSSAQQRPRKGRKGRSLQRQRALDVLYEADLRSGEIDLSELLEQRSQQSPAQEPIKAYGQEIVRTYVEWADNVDSMIEAASPQWSLARMSIVDRSLLRIGTTELMFMDVPIAIVIKEITSLVRDFSNDKAVGFTMGVLNRIAEIRSAETSGRATE